MRSEKDHNRDTGAKPEVASPAGSCSGLESLLASRQAHAPQASRASGRLEKDHSLVQSPEKQKQMLDFIVTSYFHSPADVEELKCAVIIASDNSSPTPNADRWFLEGVFAALRFLGGENGKSL